VYIVSYALPVLLNPLIFTVVILTVQNTTNKKSSKHRDRKIKMRKTQEYQRTKDRICKNILSDPLSRGRYSTKQSRVQSSVYEVISTTICTHADKAAFRPLYLSASLGLISLRQVIVLQCCTKGVWVGLGWADKIRNTEIQYLRV
jgi:hypothetical protein